MPVPDHSPRPPEERLARVLYGVQVGVPLLLLAIAVALGPDRVAPLAESLSSLRWIGLAAGLLATAMASLVRSRLDVPRNTDASTRRRAWLVSVIIPWSILELGGMAQAVIYWLTGDSWMLGIFALFFLLPMAAMTPSRFEQR